MMNSCTTTVGNSQILTAGEKVAANLTPTLKLLRRDHRAAIIYMGCLAERTGVNLTKLCRLAGAGSSLASDDLPGRAPVVSLAS